MCLPVLYLIHNNLTFSSISYPANPMNESSKARLVTEKKWLSLGNQLGVSTYVFRLGGIYGPGRRFVCKKRATLKYFQCIFIFIFLI